jgi:hypothetical protein
LVIKSHCEKERKGEREEERKREREKERKREREKGKTYKTVCTHVMSPFKMLVLRV